MTLSIFF